MLLALKNWICIRPSTTTVMSSPGWLCGGSACKQQPKIVKSQSSAQQVGATEAKQKLTHRAGVPLLKENVDARGSFSPGICA